MELQLFCILITLALLTYLIFKLVSIPRVPTDNARTVKFPPGPWKLPIIGSIHHLDGSSLPHHALRDLSRIYGPIMHLQLGEISTTNESWHKWLRFGFSQKRLEFESLWPRTLLASNTTYPILGIWPWDGAAYPPPKLFSLSKKKKLGEISTIVISSPQIEHYVLKTHDLAFANRPPFFTDSASQVISFAPYGAYWKQMRKIVTSELLSPQSVRRFSSIRESEVMELIKHLQQSSGSPINQIERSCSLTNAITSRAAFGKRSQDEDLVIKLIKEASSLVGDFQMSYLFPSLTLLHRFSRVKAKILSVNQKLNTLMQKIVKEHQVSTEITGRGNGESGEEDLVDVLLRHQMNEHLDCPVTTDNIKAVIMDVTAGGVDTSSTTIEWAMAEMMKNPIVMEKAQNEVRQAFTGCKMMRETDVEGLKYLKWVIKETLRLHPPIPLLLPREAREQCEIDGYTIPVKTNVIVNAWAIGRDPEYWDDAESFVPERFEDISVGFLGNELHYIPFGAGRRSCPDMSEKFGVTAGRKKELYLVALPYYPTHEN